VEKPIHIGSFGAFGESVAAHLRTLRSDVCETKVTDDTLTTILPAASLHILAASRRTRKLLALFESTCYESHTPFIPLMVDFRTMMVGPIVVPENGPCLECFERRTRQHSNHFRDCNKLDEFYSEHPGAGPRGYIEAFAMIGAAQISSIVDSLEDSFDSAGQLWKFDLLTLEITVSRVIGIDGCLRCGLHRHRETRTVTEMKQALNWLWRRNV
jgi:bacteriocin biosynthesis cyclodehydratase domain-containing protein